MLTRENKVEIIGTIESNNLVKDNSAKVGAYIRGNLVIKVTSPKPMSIPISYFAAEKTKENKPRKLYGQLEQLRVGQKIGITASVGPNKFWDTTRGQLVKGKRLNVVFINAAKVEDADKAEFTFSGFIVEPLKEVHDKEGALTGYSIKIGQADYSGSLAEVIGFTVDPKDQKSVRYIEKEYTSGKTVKVSGLLDYDIKTETRTEEVDFGSPITKQFQRTISNLTITGGVSVAEGNYEKADIENLLAGEATDDRAVEADAKTKEKAGAVTSTNKPQVASTSTNQSLL